MSKRMNKSDRRTQLLGIMETLRERATCQGDFTADRIAEAAGGISAAWVYELVGAEFKTLRAELKGPRRSPEDTERKLRDEIRELRRRLKELEAKYKAEIAGDFSAAVRHIEVQDERIRSLVGLVKLLQGRSRESGHKNEVIQRATLPNKESFEELTPSISDDEICDLSAILDATNNYSN